MMQLARVHVVVLSIHLHYDAVGTCTCSGTKQHPLTL
jgi:hypothetical protein